MLTQLVRMPANNKIVCHRKPDRVWLSLPLKWESHSGEIPRQLVHGENAALLDEMHDWQWNRGFLRFTASYQAPLLYLQFMDKLQELSLQNRTWCIDQLQLWHQRGALLLDTPYQRGVVWGVKRQRNFIRSLLMKVPVPSLIINNRGDIDFEDESTGYAVIDGKQRITTILNFMDSKLPVPAEWFVDVEKDGDIVFDQLSSRKQARFMNRPIAAAETSLKTLAEEKQVFELINFGGLAQGEIDEDIPGVTSEQENG